MPYFVSCCTYDEAPRLFSRIPACLDLFAIQDAIAMVAAGRRATAQVQKWKYGRQELPKGEEKNAGVSYRDAKLCIFRAGGLQ